MNKTRKRVGGCRAVATSCGLLRAAAGHRKPGRWPQRGCAERATALEAD